MAYSASMLNIWWKMFPVFNVANPKATWLKFCESLLIILLVTQ